MDKRAHGGKDKTGWIIDNRTHRNRLIFYGFFAGADKLLKTCVDNIIRQTLFCYHQKRG